MDKLKFVFKKILSAFVGIITNQYVLVVLAALLVMFAVNFIMGVGIGIAVFCFFWTIIYTVNKATSKRTHIICFAVCFGVFVSFLGMLLYKLPSFSYNFGEPKNISCSEDIDYCLSKGIKHVSFIPEKVNKTKYVEREDVDITGNRVMGPNDGRIRFYYSIVELEDVKLLLKHSQEALHKNETLAAYLTKLETGDMQIYEKFQKKNLFKAILVCDEETFNSDLFGWRMWTVFQCLICLAGIITCVYIVIRYKKRFSLAASDKTGEVINVKIVSVQESFDQDK